MGKGKKQRLEKKKVTIIFGEPIISNRDQIVRKNDDTEVMTQITDNGNLDEIEQFQELERKISSSEDTIDTLPENGENKENVVENGKSNEDFTEETKFENVEIESSENTNQEITETKEPENITENEE